ncbi:LOW QUALITY PROTEIN: hypothetical protein KUTeg_023541 [Tegillarca granosa]|uniref:Methyltransferase domain-containing protein n=1 Tax=Tegillarca granosa TaxID=220873 RepID=A0ABQ9E1Y4_TEGGR|nr:LOW QUALITY PROTEIN: hypothetical protein KUTeg_023541 [Tegillarca granosa]
MEAPSPPVLDFLDADVSPRITEFKLLQSPVTRYVNSLQRHCNRITRVGPLSVNQVLEVPDQNGVKPSNPESGQKTIELPTTNIDILTLDMGAQVVEYLKDSMKTSSIKNVKQLSFFLPGIDDFSKKKNYMEYLNVLRDLYTSGYRIVWTGRLMEQVFNRHPKRSKTYVITMVADSPKSRSITADTYLIPSQEKLKSLPLNQLGVIFNRIDNDFSFDDDIADTYECEVHSFDPSLNLKKHQHASRVWFYPLGSKRKIKGYRGGYWQLDTIDNIRRGLGHDKRQIDVLKMDIEHAEWDVIPSLAKSGLLQDVVQLSVEIHTPTLRDSDERYLKYLSDFKFLYDSGFRIFWSFTNTNCKYYAPDSGQERTACYELDMVNINTATS